MIRFHALTCLLVVAACIGCTASPTQTTKKTPSTSKTTKPEVDDVKPLPNTITLTGTAMGAASLVAQGAGNLIAQGGGNVIAQGGGNLIAQGGGNYQLTALSEVPMAKAQIYLSKADGTPLDLAPADETDAKGNFEIKNVPIGETIILSMKVQQDGKDTFLQTLALPSKDSTQASLNVGTSLVALTVLDGFTGKPGKVDVGTWVETVEYCHEEVKKRKWPALYDAKARGDWMVELEGESELMAKNVPVLLKDVTGR